MVVLQISYNCVPKLPITKCDNDIYSTVTILMGLLLLITSYGLPLPRKIGSAVTKMGVM